ncbi:hypothetical protein ACLMJK_006322 [Lecanora helva]
MAPRFDDVDSISFTFANGPSNMVNLDDQYDEDSDDTLLGDEFEEYFVRLTPDPIFRRSKAPSVEGHTQRLVTLSHQGQTYRPGKTVELRDGDFLRIDTITLVGGSVSLQGIIFRRNKLLDGLLEFKRNEVTMLISEDENDERDIYQQSRQTIQLTEVIRIRKLVKTNAPFPLHSYREADAGQDKDYILHHGRLVCRTKLIADSKNKGYLAVLLDTETDSGYRVNPKQMRLDFRGETEKGGICSDWLTGEKEFDDAERMRSGSIDILGFHRYEIQRAESVVDLTVDRASNPRRYTLGDAFCGAGGVSRGAKAASFRVDWGFDFDPAAIESYRKNFHRARCEAIAAHDFVTIITENFKVDVLHMSPPCQTFSPYHVHNGRNDELNQATFFAIEELLKKTKPRIVTLEETYGLTAMVKHQAWFRAMIQVFAKLGFSVRWKVVRLCDYGLPGPRRRLVLFASCPGEPLPDFPPPTHCKLADQPRFPHLKPYTTINDAIARIPRDFPLHNPTQVMQINEAPYDGNQPLRHTICTNGNLYYHPSGKRNFTLRELACLNGFPLEHQFDPRRARMQIGNAVPPIFAKVVFEHIRKHLLRIDGLA